MKITVSRNLFIILAVDIIILVFSFYLAHLIRFEFSIPPNFMTSFVEILPYMIIVKLLCFFFFNLYRGMWRYTSLNDLMNVGKASTVATLIIIAVVLYVNRFHNVSRSIIVIDWFFTIFFIMSLRLATRIYFEQFSTKISFETIKEVLRLIFWKRVKPGTGVIIIGAGNCGEKIVREIKDNTAIQYNILAFLDDDPKKIGRQIHGINVLNSIDQIEHAVQSTEAAEIIIAMPSAPADRIRYIVEKCKSLNIKYRIVPDMGELINGKVTLSAIRNVEYRDLLGREPVELDKQKISEYIHAKTVLVSGAGGSIGSELCKQICRYNPAEIILFERSESPLYEIDLQLKKDFKGIKIIPVLADVQDKDELVKVFEAYHPSIVFHAAAYKHVPMLEMHPWKAVENNIVGTKNIVEVSHRFECEKFVFVSTDKAVNPTSVMGTSKRVAELIVQNKNTCSFSKTQFITVRFGNVIGSVGSVIPLFKKQIKEGGPVTVTHPDMVRYFMLIPEACQLILQSGTMGKGGEIFILEMGNPVKIADMAKDLIRFSGFEPDVEIKIEYIGLRPGEKLFEELMTKDEDAIPTDHDKILVFNRRDCDIDFINEGIRNITKVAKSRKKSEIIKEMKKIVPEYSG